MTKSRKFLVFKILGVILALFIGAVFFAVTLILINPEFVINRSNAQKVIAVMNSEDIKIVSEFDNISVENHSLFIKSIAIRLENTTFAGKEIKFKTEQTNINLKIDLLNWPYLVTEIGPIQVKNSDLHLTIKAKQEDEKASEPIDWNGYKNILANIKVKPVSIKNFVVEIQDEQKKIQSLKADVELKLDASKSAVFKASVMGLKNIPIKKLDSLVTFDFENHENLPGIDVKIDGDFGKQGRVSGSMSLDKMKSDGSKFQSVKADISYKLGKVRIEGKIAGAFSKSGQIKLSPNITASNISDSLDNVEVSKCHISGGFIDSEFDQGEILLESCLVGLQRNRFEDEDELFAIPKKISFNLNGNYKYSFSDNFDSIFAKLHADLVPFKTDMYEVEGSTGFVLDGKFSDFENSAFDIALDSHLSINHFSNVVKSLRSTDLAIPAPFNTLVGKIGCDLKGKIQLNDKTANVPIACQTNLSGPKQSIDIVSQGVFRLLMHDEGVQPDLEMLVTLEDVALQLPDIKVAQGVPALKSDSRIVDEVDFTEKTEVGPEGKSKTLPLNYNIVIKNGSNPIKIYSPDIASFIPVAVDLKLLSSAGMSGEIAIQPFEIKIFNKTTKISHITLTFIPDEPIGIDALIVVPRVDSDVLVSVYGNSLEPKYKIYSDPPRAESEVMASLMYGQSGDGLSSDKQRSVSETQAAIADGAIGLISMFYLASTPIQSVGYNPSSGVFSAAVEVREGVSLSIGTSQEGRNQVGVSKRLGGNWSIETFAVKNRESDTNKGVAMLRWAKRY